MYELGETVVGVAMPNGKQMSTCTPYYTGMKAMRTLSNLLPLVHFVDFLLKQFVALLTDLDDFRICGTKSSDRLQYLVCNGGRCLVLGQGIGVCETVICRKYLARGQDMISGGVGL
jgi:hypothetical protein